VLIIFDFGHEKRSHIFVSENLKSL